MKNILFFYLLTLLIYSCNGTNNNTEDLLREKEIQDSITSISEESQNPFTELQLKKAFKKESYKIHKVVSNMIASDNEPNSFIYDEKNIADVTNSYIDVYYSDPRKGYAIFINFNTQIEDHILKLIVVDTSHEIGDGAYVKTFLCGDPSTDQGYRVEIISGNHNTIALSHDWDKEQRRFRQMTVFFYEE